MNLRDDEVERRASDITNPLNISVPLLFQTPKRPHIAAINTPYDKQPIAFPC